MRALGIKDALVSFLITICLACLIFVAFDSPFTHKTPGTGAHSDESSLFASSTLGKGLSTINFDDMLHKYTYIFVKWFRLVVSYVAMPFALPLRLVNGEWA